MRPAGDKAGPHRSPLRHAMPSCRPACRVTQMGLRAQPPANHAWMGDDGSVGHRAEGGAEKGDAGCIRPDGCHPWRWACRGSGGGRRQHWLSPGGGGVHPPVGEGGAVVSTWQTTLFLTWSWGQILLSPPPKAN